MADTGAASGTYSLAYGLRLLPSEELDSVRDAVWTSTSGQEGRVTMHLIEGDIATIRARLHESIDAFFEIFAPDEE